MPPASGVLRFRCVGPGGRRVERARAFLRYTGRIDSHSLLCDPDAATTQRVPAGSYVLSLQGDGVVDVYSHAVEIHAGEGTDVTLHLQAGVRRTLSMRPKGGVAWNLGKTVGLIIRSRETGKAIVDQPDYYVVKGEVRIACSLGLGVHELTLVAKDGKRWDGIYDNESLTPSDETTNVWMLRR